MAIIQFIDFATDILVIAELFKQSDSLWPKLAVVFVALSMCLSMLFLPFINWTFKKDVKDDAAKGRPNRLKEFATDRGFNICMMLAPINLHLFYWGILLGRAEAALDDRAIENMHFF